MRWASDPLLSSQTQALGLNLVSQAHFAFAATGAHMDNAAMATPRVTCLIIVSIPQHLAVRDLAPEREPAAVESKVLRQVSVPKRRVGSL